MDYAIFRSGSKQYKVRPGTVIDVDRLKVEEGSSLEINDVLAVSRDGDVLIGNPVVPDASVIAQVECHDKDKKILVFKYKRKVRYRRNKGHRQHYTRLSITSILLGGEEIGISQRTESVSQSEDMLTAEDTDSESEEEMEEDEAIAEDTSESENQIDDAEEDAAEESEEEGAS